MASTDPGGTFAELGLSPEVVRGAKEQGLTTPTPVQRAVIPHALEGADIWASARTGSGKTAAFVLPILERLGRQARAETETVRALVLVPTRELAEQVGDVVARLSRHVRGRLRTVVLVGGLSKNPQRMALRGGADVVVATPGRLLDLANDGALRLGDAGMVVLDEADRLLALGFTDELAQITERIATTPGRRAQRLLFSATFPPAVRSLASALLDAPVRIEVDRGTPLADVVAAQRVIEVDARRRPALLVHLLGDAEFSQALVFVASGRGAEDLARALVQAKIPAAPLHGDLAQTTRARALQDLRDGRLRVLVATDLAARGIDVPALPLVVNFDLPRSPADYLHRIGRTSRAGVAGVAISFVGADGAAHFRLIEKRHGLALARERLAGFEPTDVATPVRDPHGGVKGKRKSKKDKLREAAAIAAKKPA